jgi:hypothetical protein
VTGTGMNAPASRPTDDLLRWVEGELAAGRSEAIRSHQGTLHILRHADPPLIVKVPGGRGPVRWMRAVMLRREHRAYLRLEGVPGIPRCLGLVRGPGLVLTYHEGVQRRLAEIDDLEAFYAELLEVIHEVHRRGVAHGDLARRNNLLVVDRRHPLVLDFGMSVVSKPGFRPVNRMLFSFTRQVDLNHWVKIKYDRNLREASPADLALYRRTLPERIAAGIKSLYTDEYGQRPSALGGKPPSEDDPPVRVNSVRDPSGVWRRPSGKRTRSRRRSS